MPQFLLGIIGLAIIGAIFAFLKVAATVIKIVLVVVILALVGFGWLIVQGIQAI